MDWPGLYAREVSPTLRAIAAPTPAPILALAAGATLVGVLVLALAPGSWRLVGLGPLLMVGFGVVMVTGNRRRARTGVCVVRRATVRDKRVEKSITTTTTGISQPRYTHVLELEVAEASPLTETGRGDALPTGAERMTVSEELYATLDVGDEVWAVSLPTGPRHCHMLVEPDGTVRR